MTITGTVFDGSGVPLMGVNVYPLKNGSPYGKGGITNYDGYFNIDIEDLTPDQTVKFSYIGFAPVELPAEKLKNRIIQMNEMLENLDTVIVTATKPQSTKRKTDPIKIANAVGIGVLITGLAVAGYVIYNTSKNG